MFGRGGEEFEALKEADVPCTLVPGITSAVAVPEAAGIPVTHRGISRSFHVITGHTGDGSESLTPEALKELAASGGTLVFLMGLSRIDHICTELMNAGVSPDLPAAVITKGTTKEQRQVRKTVSTIAQACRQEGMTPPGILVVGRTAAFDFKSSLQGPLGGCRVGLTGTRPMVKKMRAQVEALGGCAVDLGIAGIERLALTQEELAIIKEPGEWDWIVFTSANGVRIYFELLRENQVDVRKLSRLRVAAIGPGTAKVLEEYGIFADYIPDHYTSHSLGQGLLSLTEGEKNVRILAVRAKGGSKEIKRIFCGTGVSFRDLPVYQILQDEELWMEKRKELTGIDYLVFLSASGVRGIMDRLDEKEREELSRTKLVCIGPEAAKALKACGFTDILTASRCDTEGVTETVAKDFVQGTLPRRARKEQIHE